MNPRLASDVLETVQWSVTNGDVCTPNFGSAGLKFEACWRQNIQFMIIQHFISPSLSISPFLVPSSRYDSSNVEREVKYQIIIIDKVVKSSTI